MNTHKIFNLMMAIVFALSLLGKPLPVSAQELNPAISAQVDAYTLHIRAYIDGESQLIISGDTVQWHHIYADAPGRWSGADPTYINGIAWYPTWPDIPNSDNQDCNCDSSTLTGVAPALPAQDQNISMKINQARNLVSIVQQPNSGNGYTLIVDFDDSGPGGADWYDIELSISANMPSNSAPVITEGDLTSVTMSQNGSPNPFNLTLTATDADSNRLSWSISSPASHGTASVSGTGYSKDISYAPNTNYAGTDSFVVQVDDGNGGMDTITINVTINATPTAGIRYVTTSGTGDCSSWADACGLQTALTAAISGDEIWVAAGTYTPTAGTGRNATFQLKSGVALYGGFSGMETARDQRNPAAKVSIMSGDLNGDDVGFSNNTENSYHVVVAENITGATLDGFTITGGNATVYMTGPNTGGGIAISGSNLTLTNDIISGNVANYGGGMITSGGNLTLTNVTFSGNLAGGGFGGGMFISGSSPTLTNVTFSGNSAGTYGGGIIISGGGSPVLTNVTFADNSSVGGGAIDGGTPTIRNSIFWGNTAGGNTDVFGAQLYESNPVIYDSVIQGGCPDGGTCTNVITADPRLGTLGNYGGFTQTIPLLTGSSAIDAGNDATCAVTDQRGITRPQGAHCDIGAYEYEWPLNQPPGVNAGGPYTVDEGSSVMLTATGSDPEGQPLTYVWDLDNNGSFETPGQSVSFTGIDGPSDHTVAVQVTDNGGLTATAQSIVHVNNIAPTATFNAPASVNEGDSFALSLTNPVDVSADLGSLQYAFDCGNGYGAFSTSNTATCTAVDNPGVTVKGKVQDKDSGVTESNATITVNNVAPTVAGPVVSPEPSIESSSVIASATFTDPGVNDAPFTCTVNYGDGSGNLPGTSMGYTCTGPGHVYSAFGAYTVIVSVTDKDGGTRSKSAIHIVTFTWSGFFQPVDNPPVLNLVKAGSAVPMKFSLGGNKGLNIFAAGYPQSVKIVCNTGLPVDEIEQAVTAGSSSLSYDASSDQYNYVWKTDKTWTGTCRQWVVKLIDGSVHYAIFKFK